MVIFFSLHKGNILKTTSLLIKCVVVVKKKKSNVAECNELKKFLLNMDVSLNVSKLVFLFIT